MNERENRCPDGGYCHGSSLPAASEPCPPGKCLRVITSSPLTGVFPGDRWPADLIYRLSAEYGGPPEPAGYRCWQTDDGHGGGITHHVHAPGQPWAGMSTTINRHEGQDGYVIVRSAVVTGLGIIRGEDHHQYITGDDEYAVGSQLTLRVTYLNGETITEPSRARAIWQEAGWL